MNIQLTLTEILNKLSVILQEYPDMDEQKINSIKSKFILSIAYDKNQNDEKIENRCEGVYKSGPKKGTRCKTMINYLDTYCKKHIPDNKMGTWAKSRSRNNSDLILN